MKRFLTTIIAVICANIVYLFWGGWIGTDSESLGMYITTLIVVCTNIILAKIEKKDSGK